jgi:hypothetical protein
MGPEPSSLGITANFERHPRSNQTPVAARGAAMEEIVDIAKRQRKTNVEHHFYADDFGAGFEVANGECFVIQ